MIKLYKLILMLIVPFIGASEAQSDSQIRDYQNKIDNYAIYYSSNLEMDDIHVLSGLNSLEYDLTFYSVLFGDIAKKNKICHPSLSYVCYIGNNFEFVFPVDKIPENGQKWCVNNWEYQVKSISFKGINKHTLFGSEKQYYHVMARHIENRKKINFVFNLDTGIIAIGLKDDDQKGIVYNLITKKGLLAHSTLESDKITYVNKKQLHSFVGSCK